MRFQLLFFVSLLFISSCVTSQPDLELIRLTLENKYRTVGQFDPDTRIATIYDNMLMGYVNIDGKEILPLGEYATSDFSDGIGIYYTFDKKTETYTHYAVDKNCKTLKVFNGLHYLKKFKRGVAIAGDTTGNYGLMTLEGQVKIPFKYSHIERLTANYFLAQDTSWKFGVIDINNKIIVPHQFGQIIHIDTVSLKIWAYRYPDGYSVFDASGKLLKSIPAKNIDIESVAIEGQHYDQREGLILLEEDETERLSVVNLNFETIVPFGKYLDVDAINEGRIRFSLKVESQKLDERVTMSHFTTMGFMDLTGKVVIEPELESALYFTEGLCAAAKGGKWGYIDKNGKAVIPFQYTYCLPFSKGYAKVQVGDKFFIIDKTGKVVLNSKPYW